jgi:hypothetical protein
MTSSLQLLLGVESHVSVHGFLEKFKVPDSSADNVDARVCEHSNEISLADANEELVAFSSLRIVLKQIGMRFSV